MVSKKYDFECVNNPVATYRIHNDQLQNKNFQAQADQYFKWYEKLKFTKEFGSENKLNIITPPFKFSKFKFFINHNLKNKSLIFLSTFILFAFTFISIKSITINPAIFLN